MTKFQWSDPFLLEEQLSLEEKMIMKTANQYSQEKLFPRIKSAWKNETMDKSIFHEMGELGLLGCTLPEEYGGINANYVSYGLIAREIENVDSSYRSMMSVQSSLVMHPIYAFGSNLQKEKYLPKLAKGEFIGCFGLTEADAGSDPSSMLTTAKKVDDGYVLNGSKMWISNSPIADIFIIWAKSQAHDNKIKGFILEKGMKGLSAPVIEGKMSLRASITGEIILENVHVSNNHILDGVSGLKGPFECLNRARYGISWGVMGAAEFCWKASLDYGLSRKQFNRPLAQTQLWQKKLVDMQTEISLGLSGCLHAGRSLDNGKDIKIAISMLKRNNCKKAIEIVREARDMMGANGLIDEYHIMRHLVNLETVKTYEGAEDIHALILGKFQTDMDSF